jgi:hypothetical protein
MRLHRHDEIVEAMARASYDKAGGIRWNDAGPHMQKMYLDMAAAALDAMLEAVVRLGGTIEPGDPCFVIPLEKPKP